ncbi:MAG: LysE family translocator [Pseudomonadota bacterium]
MIELSYLIAPCLAFLIAAGSPGPATLAVMGTSMLRGRRAGYALSAGLTLGLAFWGWLAAAGFGALLVHWAPGMLALRLIGGAYLLYLAWQSAKSALREEDVSISAVAAEEPRRMFLRGLLLNLTNPKALLAWAAVIAIGIGPTSTPGEIATIVSVCTAIGLVIYLGYAAFFSTNRVMRTYRSARRSIEGIFAALFGAAAMKLIFGRADPT